MTWIDLTDTGPSALGPDSLGEALRLLRHRTRLTRDALAGRVGASAGAISNYENDISTPSAATLRRLASTFGDLLGTDPRILWDQLGALVDRRPTVPGA